MGSKGFVVVATVAILAGYGSITGARSVSEQEEGETLELLRQLDVLNKPPIKSFKVRCCLHMYVCVYKVACFFLHVKEGH